MSNRIIPIRYGLMTGGEAHIFSIYDMPYKYSTLLQNCHVSQRGGIEKIPGYIKMNAASCGVNLTTGFEFKKTDGTRLILPSGGGKIFKLDEGAGTLTAIKESLDASAKVSFAATNNLCIMVNGVDTPMKYDGTTVSSLGGSPPATAFKAHVHKGRVWLLGRTNKMLATHSSLNNPEEYTGGTSGYIDFKYILKKGDELLDVATYVDLLVFYFRDHIVIYSGTTPSGTGADFQIVQVVEGCGIKETGAIRGYASDAAFIHDAGVKSLKQVVTTGALTIGEISEAIAPTIRSEIIANTGNVYAMAHYPSKSWIMCLINNKVWIYSYFWKAWGRMVGADVHGLFDTTQKEVFLCGSNYLYKYGAGYDFAGNDIDLIWESPHIAFNRRRGRTGYPKIGEVLMNPSLDTTINYYSKYDYEPVQPQYYGSFTSPSSYLFDDVTDVNAIDPFDYVAANTSKRFPLFGGGKTMQLVFYNNSQVGPIEINDLLVLAELGGY